MLHHVDQVDAIVRYSREQQIVRPLREAIGLDGASKMEVMNTPMVKKAVVVVDIEKFPAKPRGEIVSSFGCRFEFVHRRLKRRRAIEFPSVVSLK